MMLFPFLLYSLELFVGFGTPDKEIRALESLYNSTDGEQWKWKNEILFGSRWSFPQASAHDPCSDDGRTWQGITCSSRPGICQLQECHIVEISLVEYGLNGTLPNVFSQLTGLTSLQINSNKNLFGSLPISVGSLVRLQYLDIAENRLSSSLPSSLGSLAQLKDFVIDDNVFTAPFLSHLINSIGSQSCNCNEMISKD